MQTWAGLGAVACERQGLFEASFSDAQAFALLRRVELAVLFLLTIGNTEPN